MPACKKSQGLAFLLPEWPFRGLVQATGDQGPGGTHRSGDIGDRAQELSYWERGIRVPGAVLPSSRPPLEALPGLVGPWNRGVGGAPDGVSFDPLTSQKWVRRLRDDGPSPRTHGQGGAAPWNPGPGTWRPGSLFSCLPTAALSTWEVGWHSEVVSLSTCQGHTARPQPRGPAQAEGRPGGLRGALALPGRAGRAVGQGPPPSWLLARLLRPLPSVCCDLLSLSLVYKTRGRETQ